ncbi:hypothetical protein MMC31_006026 [Peltigera leucophlebia]|nr:hypothetical protein [Peltigera leucophlebia]
MSPRRAPATKQRPAKHALPRKQSSGVQKTTKPKLSARTTRARACRLLDTSIDHSTCLRRRTRSSTKTAQAQVRRSAKTTIVHSNSLEPVQEPSAASQNLTKPLQSAKRKRKRELEVEDKLLDKRQRTESRSVVDWVQQLNDANLERYTSQPGVETFDGMGSRKRTLSTRSSVADVNQEVASVSSQKATSLANYRWKNLDYARIVVEDEPIPENVESRVNAIIRPEISKGWESELARITETFCNDFIDVLKGASREDDSVEPIHHALTSIDRKSEFMFPRKAGTSHSATSAFIVLAHTGLDWDVTLKPDVQRKTFHLDILARPDDAADNSLNRPNKRQQAETSYASPDNSEPTVPHLCLHPNLTSPLWKPRVQTSQLVFAIKPLSEK